MKLMRLFTLTAALAVFAPNARAEVITSISTRGESASMSFGEVVSVVCADGGDGFFAETISLFSTEEVVKAKGAPKTPTSSVFVFYRLFDSCDDEPNVVGRGTLTGASVQDGLDSATLVGTVELTELDGTPVGEVEFDLTLTGVGGIATNRFHSRSVASFPDGTFTVIERGNGSSREATVAGSVLVNGVEFVDLFRSAQLTNYKNGFLEVVR